MDAHLAQMRQLYSDLSWQIPPTPSTKDKRGDNCMVTTSLMIVTSRKRLKVYDQIDPSLETLSEREVEMYVKYESKLSKDSKITLRKRFSFNSAPFYSRAQLRVKTSKIGSLYLAKQLACSDGDEIFHPKYRLGGKHHPIATMQYLETLYLKLDAMFPIANLGGVASMIFEFLNIAWVLNRMQSIVDKKRDEKKQQKERKRAARKEESTRKRRRYATRSTTKNTKPSE